MYNPYQYMNYNGLNAYQNVPNNAPSGLIRVTGIDGAKAYQMQPNSVTALFDNNTDIMYIKTTDGANFPTIRTFKFTEIKDTAEKMGEYVSRAEFENFKKELLSYGKQSISSTTADKSADITASKEYISKPE